jgi:hypothetical protein
MAIKTNYFKKNTKMIYADRENQDGNDPIPTPPNFPVEDTSSITPLADDHDIRIGSDTPPPFTRE